MRNKPTLYIFIALVLGVIVGYIYNVKVLSGINKQISLSSAAIKSSDASLKQMTDTTTAQYQLVKKQRAGYAAVKKDFEKQQEDKLLGYSILSDIFLRLIKLIVAPLVLTTLVVGVAKVGDIKAVGRIGVKTLAWFLSATIVSLLLGMLLVNLFEPGQHMHLTLPQSGVVTDIKKASLNLKDFVGHVFPTSIADAMANNNILQIVVFALMFGIATAAIGSQGDVIIKFMDAVAHAILKVTGYVMKLAPLAVFGAITAIVAKQGLGILGTYATFISEFYISLLLLWLVIVAAGFFVLGKRSLTLLNNIKDAVLLAFSTSTSEAAFPRLMEELENFGCNNKIVSFVLPLGYSFNLDGSMMYMTFASIFLAQAYGIHLGFIQQITMLLVLMLTSKGIAGVPRASLVVIAGTIGMFNIPEAGLALIIGIDPLLDMGRSATNVLGNATATAVVSKWEKELGEPNSQISE